MEGREPATPISVVVSTYDRSALLPDLVEGLQQQGLERFEVVIVDNGSHDDTHDRLLELTRDDPRFRVLRIEDNRGPGRARNVGWRAARSPLIAFTDDDCIPQPDWLTSLCAAAERSDIVQGRTIRVPTQPRLSWFDRGQTIESWSGRYETCNLAFPRSLLERLDGFTEQFPVAMGEDTDLGLRAEALGATAEFAPDALVHHHVWPYGFRDYLALRRRLAEEVALVRENPAARRNLKFGFTRGGTHLGIWALVPMTAVSLAWGHPWVLPAAVGCWCALNMYRTRHWPWSAPSRFAYSLVEFVGRVYETWCYAAAAVRYRTLVI